MTKTAQNNNSLKTFFVYAGIVCFFIVLSLAIKAFFIISASKFDGKHQFVVAIAQKSNVKEIVSFNPSERTVTIFKIKGRELPLQSFGKTLGIIPDTKVDTQDQFQSDDDIGETIKKFVFKYNSIKTDMTIFDLTRLMFLSQKISLNNQVEKEIIVSNDRENNNKLVANLFTDNDLFSENVSIQIINASGSSGIGKRLEVALANLGCNIVAVSTSRKEEHLSKIQYFGDQTYTVKKLHKLVGFPIEKSERKSIATIVITIGQDSKNSENF